MKLNRFFAMAAMALLVVGAMGVISARSLAQTAQPPAQTQVTEAPEANSEGSDTNNLDEQVGDQNAPDSQEAGHGAEAADGSEQEAAPAGTPAITAEAAQKTAEAYLNAGVATEVELENENGNLVYSVEIGGTDVIIDAMTGEILSTKTGED